MQTSKTKLWELRYLGIAGTLILILTACGGGQSTPADGPEGESPSETPAAQTETDAPGEASVGSITFAVDGEEKNLEYLPESVIVYTPLASSIRAHSEAGSTESLAIHFMAIDLKKLTYPTDLPLPKDPSKPMDPMAAMASVGFGYFNAEGAEWAGPGKIQIESFGNDGVIRGTFDQVSLPHTDDEHPNIELTDGSFSARITSPW